MRKRGFGFFKPQNPVQFRLNSNSLGFFSNPKLEKIQGWVPNCRMRRSCLLYETRETSPKAESTTGPAFALNHINQGEKVEHNGVKVELLGQIEMYFDRGNFYDFTSLVRELDVPGDIYERKAYPFEFPTVDMPYETYNGVNVRLSQKQFYINVY